MGYETPDLYNQPEAFELEPIVELDERNMSYDFNTYVVWRHKPTGKLYLGHDQGCSCPTPWEEFTSLDKATELTEMTQIVQLQRELKAESFDNPDAFPPDSVRHFCDTVIRAFYAWSWAQRKGSR